jgi:S1-C subfamily serine protease
VVVSVDGQPLADGAGLTYAISAHRPGDTIRLGVRRGGAEQTLNLRAEPAPATPAKDERTITGRNPFDGATVVNLSPAVAEDLGVDPFAARGVMISGIGRGFALNAGLRPGDLIRSVNGRQIQTTRDLAAAAAGASDTWRVTIVRGGEEISATFRS